MECRGCGKAVDDANVRMVAKWPFCPDCFQDLLEKKEAPPAPLEEPAREAVAAAAPPEAAAPATLPCHLCRRQTAADLLKKVGIWMFCPACYADLAAPAVEDALFDGQSAPEGAAEQPDDMHADDAATGVSAPGRIEAPRFANCNRCGRRIPEAGGKDLDGQTLCPDCYYKGARQQAAAVEGGEFPAEPLPPATAAADGPSTGQSAARCQSCDQPGDPSSFAEAEGFRICKACIGADRDLAVRIARSRRLKLMQRMETEFS